ncbi:hypothetical protein AGMMS49921_02120 [Endomicrobiia bacterium]|nr:hypothetical protein AGMMS49921_02120 [Endomicrobiia bacterium]
MGDTVYDELDADELVGSNGVPGVQAEIVILSKLQNTTNIFFIRFSFCIHISLFFGRFTISYLYSQTKE